jgi:hypothetical protein
LQNKGNRPIEVVGYEMVKKSHALIAAKSHDYCGAGSVYHRIATDGGKNCHKVRSWLSAVESRAPDQSSRQ